MRPALASLLMAMPLAGLAADELAPPLQDPVREYATRIAAPAAERCRAGEVVTLPVTLAQEALVDTAYDAATGRLRILYRMQFNDLTEGWNWHPDAAAAGGAAARAAYSRRGSCCGGAISSAAVPASGTVSSRPANARRIDQRLAKSITTPAGSRWR